MSPIRFHFFHGLIQVVTDIGNLIKSGKLKLTNSYLVSFHIKIFVITEDQILGRNTVNRRFCLQHIHKQRVCIIHAGNSLQFGNCSFIVGCAGGRFEVDCIAQDSRKQTTGNVFGNLDTGILVHFI